MLKETSVDDEALLIMNTFWVPFPNIEEQEKLEGHLLYTIFREGKQKLETNAEINFFKLFLSRIHMIKNMRFWGRAPFSILEKIT